MMASQNAGVQHSSSDNSFPVPLPTAASNQAPSVISSQMTDLGSENGDDYQAERTPTAIRPGTAMSGRTLDPNRPISPRSWTQSQSSRRSPASPRQFRPWRFNGAFGGPGGAMSNTSRPQSQTSSVTSRTHVPSLSSHAFFRPMSSQRLQAQRGGNRLPVGGQSMASIDGSSDFGSTTNRNSIGSNNTAQPGPDISDAIPQSRGTEFTERQDQRTNNASPTGNATIQSIESERPLHSRTLEPNTMYSDPEKQKRQGNDGLSPPQRSSRSFRPSFLLPSRGAPPQARNDRFSHERLSSSTSSPHSVNPKVAPMSAPKPSFNYQYFSGNTVFYWGGRFQNTRDRPINIISTLLIVLPSIIFFAAS